MQGKVQFQLLKPNKEGRYNVKLCFYYNNERFMYSTGLTAFKDDWNDKRNEYRTTREKPQHKDDNDLLKKFRSTFESIFSEYRLKGEQVNNDILREELDKRVKGKTNTIDKITLFKFVEKFILERKKTLSHGTTKVYITTFNHVKEYAKAKGLKEFDFSDINVEFAYEFKDYLQDAPLELSTNYVSKLFENLCHFMREAYERDLHTNIKYTTKFFRIAKEPTYAIYLNENELQKIHQFDFSDNKRLEKARDLFLVGCYTGLRFIDYTRLTPSHLSFIDNTEVVKMTTQKTTQPVVVPVVPPLRQLIEKNKGSFPEKETNQKLNEYIKEVCQIIGIDESVTFPVNKGGKNTDVTFKKYELVSSHTGRRSFATNAYKKGIPIQSIMQITGHKTETQFLKYIKVKADENAVNFAKNLGL